MEALGSWLEVMMWQPWFHFFFNDEGLYPMWPCGSGRWDVLQESVY